MLDLSTIKVVQKDWGTQVWLNDYEMLMVMHAGGETSMHKHHYHDSELWLMSGNASVRIGCGYSVPLVVDDAIPIAVENTHQVRANIPSIIYERYIPVAGTSVKPCDDIERFWKGSHANNDYAHW